MNSKTKAKNLMKVLAGYMTWLFAILAMAYVISLFVKPTIISGPSMKPLLNSGDYVIINRTAYWSNSPEKGDVVIFRHSEDGETESIVKRVIAVAGDTVEVKDGKVYVNGKPDDQSYTKDGITDETVKPTKVSEGHFFCMGDNRLDSYDSRDFGEVSEEDIIGRPFLRLFPFSRIGTF